MSISDQGIVSGARKDLERSLEGDLKKTRSENARLRDELGARDDFERSAYPALVSGLLGGWRVGVVAIGNLPSGYSSPIRDALEPAGAKMKSVDVIKAPLPLGDLASALKGTRYARLDRRERALERFGRRVGRQLATGGPLLRRVRGTLMSKADGDLRRLDAIVWVRDRDGLEGAEKDAEDRFEEAVLKGMKAMRVRIVGVEARDTDPSQIPAMSDQDLTSVDDIDLVAGRTALVYALRGADGQFGVKGTADMLLPPRPGSGR